MVNYGKMNQQLDELYKKLGDEGFIDDVEWIENRLSNDPDAQQAFTDIVTPTYNHITELYEGEVEGLQEDHDKALLSQEAYYNKHYRSVHQMQEHLDPDRNMPDILKTAQIDDMKLVSNITFKKLLDDVNNAQLEAHIIHHDGLESDFENTQKILKSRHNAPEDIRKETKDAILEADKKMPEQNHQEKPTVQAILNSKSKKEPVHLETPEDLKDQPMLHQADVVQKLKEISPLSKVPNELDIRKNRLYNTEPQNLEYGERFQAAGLKLADNLKDTFENNPEHSMFARNENTKQALNLYVNALQKETLTKDDYSDTTYSLLKNVNKAYTNTPDSQDKHHVVLSGLMLENSINDIESQYGINEQAREDRAVRAKSEAAINKPSIKEQIIKAIEKRNNKPAPNKTKDKGFDMDL